jgi:hypothetical protein
MTKRVFYATLMIPVILLLAASSCGANAPSETAANLPHSTKGYELYSWPEDGQWHFTLITGTNRNKTLEEIISAANTVSSDGWVRIHVVGMEAIKAVLSELPRSEEVFWPDSLRSEQTQEEIHMEFPPGEITEAIKIHAEWCGLVLR